MVCLRRLSERVSGVRGSQQLDLQPSVGPAATTATPIQQTGMCNRLFDESCACAIVGQQPRRHASYDRADTGHHDEGGDVFLKAAVDELRADSSYSSRGCQDPHRRGARRGREGLRCRNMWTLLFTLRHRSVISISHMSMHIHCCIRIVSLHLISSPMSSIP